MWEGMDDVLWDQVRLIVLDNIKRAAFRDFSRRGWSLNGSNGQRIDDSFDLIRKGGEIFVTSTFPGLERYATGIVLQKDEDGQVLAASLPAYLNGQWVAPTKRRDNFVYQGILAGLREAAPLLLGYQLQMQLR